MQCQICGSETAELYSLKNREIVKCVECGIIQIHNPPDIDELESAELEYQKTKPRDFERHPGWQLELDIIRELVPDGGRVLDVGCGDGAFLSMLGPEWEKHGVEVNRERAREARRKGIQVQVTSIAETKFLIKFELITMYEVLEHLYRPADALRRVRSMLKRDGLLIVSTPDSESALAKLRGAEWWSYHYPPHIFFFGHSSLERLARGLGYRIVRKRHGVHGSPLRSEKGRRLEEIAAGSSLISKNPLGDRLFFYLRKNTVPPTQ